jgi:hypothetical protein
MGIWRRRAWRDGLIARVGAIGLLRRIGARVAATELTVRYATDLAAQLRAKSGRPTQAGVLPAAGRREWRVLAWWWLDGDDIMRYRS